MCWSIPNAYFIIIFVQLGLTKLNLFVASASASKISKSQQISGLTFFILSYLF